MTLEPQIVAKLEAFARRRRKLIVVRGVCTAVALLLATMMVVALIDWLFVLPDAARWTMSAAAYLAVLLAEWRTCLRLLAHAPGPRRLARLIEHAEPRLREDLLSAVELGTANETEIFDSTRFRELVQNDVASRVAGIDVDRLLPVQLVRRYLTVAAVIVAALLVAFALTGMQAGTLLIRAFLPMANLARVSQYKVAILQPADPEPVVPHGELVSIVIQVSGGKTNKAILETFSVHEGREVLPMTPLGADKFSATIQVAREDVRYRIRAGDAITRKFQLDAEPRPHVAKFHKRYIYPDYVRKPPKDVSEETGDLVALEGSAVEIGVETSLPVKSGELRIEQGPNSEIIPLVVTPIKQGDPTTRLTAKLPLRASGTYRVHLVAARTAFENKFSPEYEIRVDPDLVPQVELELPERDLIAPANEIIDLHATATDDQSLAGVSQFVRINEENWKETVLATDSGERIKIERRWDIFEEGVKPGDLLTFKLQATDSKGNKAESRSLQITVTQSGFELTRIEALEMQRKVHEALRQLRVAGETLGKQAAELGNQFPQLGESDPRRQQLISMTVSAQTALEQVAEEAWKALGSAVPVSSAGHAAAELVLTGRMVARTNQGSAHPARDILDILQAHPDAANARDDAREVAGAAGRVAGRAALVEQAYRTFLAAEELDVANEIINVLSAEHERLATLAGNSGIDQERWRPLLKRLRVVTAECRTLEKLLSMAAPHMTGGYADRMRRLQRKMEQSRALLDEALKRAESEKPASEAFGKLSKIAQQTGRDLLALRRDLLVMKREMLPEAVQTVNHLFAEVQPTHTHLDKLQQDLRMNARNEKLSGETRANLESRRWETRIAMVKSHGDLEELRPVSDSHFVNDLRSVTLALHALQTASAELGLDRVDEKLRALEKPLRLLENAHNISELADGAQHLLAAERWELFSPHARTANPRDWEWIEGRMKVVAEELGNTGLEPPARELLREAQKRVREAIADPAARAVNEEMKQRLHPEREPKAVPDNVEYVALLLQQTLDILRKPMDEARAELAAATPRLEEVMAQLARESETLKEETSAQAARTKEQPLDQAQSAAEQMLARQESLNEKVETLKDALRSEANKHDILDQQARELARDVDDALALLKDPPQRAATALEEAAQTAQAEARQNHLHAAAVEQQKLAESLQQLSEHFAHAEQPNAQQTRMALRETESMTGVKEKLDAQYARAEQLAQMARSSPQELLAQLEKALPENPAMQRELDSISENLLASARQQLAQASQQEKQIADDVGKLAAEQQAQIDALSFQPSTPAPSSQPPAPSGNPAPSNPAAPQNPPSTPPAGGSPEATNAPPAPANGSVPPPSPARSAQLAKAAAQQAPIAAQANRAGEDVARAGRHEMRLNNTTAGGKLAQLGEEISETAKTEVPAAAKALANGSSAVQAAPAVSAANTELARELGALQAAAAAGQESADPSQRGSAAEPSSPAPPSPSPSTNPPASGQPPGTSAQSPPAAPAQKGAPNAPSPGSPGAPGEAAAPQPGSPGGTGTPQGTPSQLAATPATQQEQVWMARTLDALDAMLNATPSSSQANASQNGQQPSGAPAGSPPPGSSTVSQAMSAMNAAARSAAAAMRGPGVGDGPGEQPRSEDKVKSTAGAQIGGQHLPYAALPGAKEGKTEEWGKLPKKVAEELSQGQRENVAGEYRNQVETYYRVIAEKSRQ